MLTFDSRYPIYLLHFWPTKKTSCFRLFFFKNSYRNKTSFFNPKINDFKIFWRWIYVENKKLADWMFAFLCKIKEEKVEDEGIFIFSLYYFRKLFSCWERVQHRIRNCIRTFPCAKRKSENWLNLMQWSSSTLTEIKANSAFKLSFSWG